MHLNRISKEDIVDKVEFHQTHGIPYQVELTGSRTIFISERGGYMSMESNFKAKELSFIKDVKQYIVNNKTYKNVPNKFKTESAKNKIKYFEYNPKYKTGDVIGAGVEIDLKQAYWETLHMLPNVISEELYNKGSDNSIISKNTRLACVGTLARSSNKIEFDGVKEHDYGYEKLPETAFLWDTICYKVGQIMKEAAEIAGDDFIFFWVDAIFVTGNHKDKIVKLFHDHGYRSSTYKFESITFGAMKTIVKSKDKIRERKRNGKMEMTDERPFPFRERRQ